MRMRRYRDMRVWQLSMQLAVASYRCTQNFPVEERYGLTSQIRRAAVSVPLDSAVSFEKERSGDLLALDSGLNVLEKLDPRKCKAVELRYFVGLSIEETARALDASPATVKREWTIARAWLRRELTTA